MRRLALWLSVLLIVGHLLTEASTLAYLIWPEIDNIKINPWLDNEFVFYGDPEGINLRWFIKYSTDDLLWVITFFVLCKMAYQFSYRLFLVGATFFTYHLIDFFMLWYNYKTSAWVYVMLNAVICISVVYLFIPEKRQGKIKFME